jgi:hypothetical protein
MKDKSMMLRAPQILLFAAALGGPGNHACAQNLTGSIMNGQRITEEFCITCHEVRPKDGVALLGPQSFQAIANLPTTNALSLNVFFQSVHANMPDLHLTRSERDDLVAYILSLRK